MGKYGGILIALTLLAWVPSAAAHAGHHGPGHLGLHAVLLDASKRSFELSPIAQERPAMTFRSCPGEQALRPDDFPTCNRVTYTLLDRTLVDLETEPEGFRVRFHLSYDVAAALREVGASQAPPFEGVRLVTVEADLWVAGRSVGLDSTERTLATGDGRPQRFDFALGDHAIPIPAGSPVELRIRWWQTDAAGEPTGTSFFLLHDGGSLATHLEIPVHQDPIMVGLGHEAVDMARVCAGQSNASRIVEPGLLKIACAQAGGPVLAAQVRLSRTFENLTDVPANLTLRFVGPRPARTILGPFEANESSARRSLYIWDYAKDGADPRRYTIETFVASAGVTDGLQEHEQVLSTLVLPTPPPQSPGWGTAATMLALFAIAIVARRAGR